MSGSDGSKVLRAIKDLWPDTEVVIITGAFSVKNAKEATRLGACDYLAKPVPPNEIIMAAARAAVQKPSALRRISVRDSAQPTR
jgi:DNA-binding NtrC family response regulator